jgi:hypothetical protein
MRLSMTNRRRIMAPIDMRCQAKIVHQVARSLVLLVGRQVGLQPFRAKHRQVSQKPIVQSSVVLEPVFQQLLLCDARSNFGEN